MSLEALICSETSAADVFTEAEFDYDYVDDWRWRETG